MEEHNHYETTNNITESEKNMHAKKHCWLKCLVLLAAAFLGGFLATYFVADQMMEKMHRKHFPFNPERIEKNIIKDMEKMYHNDMKAFEDAFKKMEKMPKMKHDKLNMPIFVADNIKIKTDLDDDKYNIIIGLKPFQNDESKIKYNVIGRKLTVFGESEVKEKDFVHDIAFSQDFILPINADITNISKIKDDNNLIISVPLKN